MTTDPQYPARPARLRTGGAGLPSVLVTALLIVFATSLPVPATLVLTGLAAAASVAALALAGPLGTSGDPVVAALCAAAGALLLFGLPVAAAVVLGPLSVPVLAVAAAVAALVALPALRATTAAPARTTAPARTAAADRTAATPRTAPARPAGCRRP